MERELILERTRAGLETTRCAGRVGGRKRRMTNGKGSGRPKAIGKRDGATRTGAQLRRVGSHVISLGTGLFTDVRGLPYKANQRQHVAQLVKPALVSPYRLRDAFELFDQTPAEVRRQSVRSAGPPMRKT